MFNDDIIDLFVKKKITWCPKFFYFVIIFSHKEINVLFVF